MKYQHHFRSLIYLFIILGSLHLADFYIYGYFRNLIDTYTKATLLTTFFYLLILRAINIQKPFQLSFIVKLISAVGMAGIASSSFFYYFEESRFPKRVIVYASFLILVLIYCYRVFIYIRQKKDPIKVMIIGTDHAAQTIGIELEKRPDQYTLIAYLDYEKSQYKNIDTKKIHRNIKDISSILKTKKIDMIVLAAELENDDQLLKYVVDMKLEGYPVIYMANLYEELTGRVPLKHINNTWFIQSEFYAIYNRFYQNFKRVSDICLSIIGLILSSPALLITSLVIKLQDGGPILFVQDRVGLNGEIFKIYKFRSMLIGSESGNKYTQKNDQRITKFGRFIRKTRIDELPQFINVLKGEMSVIGPRAEWDELVKNYQKEIPYYHIRQLVKPGITGWAQVEYHYGASSEDTFEKLQYDLFYIKHQSILLDLIIALKTVRVMLMLGGR